MDGILDLTDYAQVVSFQTVYIPFHGHTLIFDLVSISITVTGRVTGDDPGPVHNGALL